MLEEVKLEGDLADWLVSSIGIGTRLISSKRLVCGPAWPVYLITTEINNQIEKFVLRLFNNEAWLKREPDMAQHEASVLEHVRGVALPTPQLIAFCPDSTACGYSVLLMSYLDGQVELRPANMERWLIQLAEALVAIHNVATAGLSWRYSSFTKVEDLRVPLWSRHRDLWQKGIDVRLAGPPPYEEAFLHRDYHPVNALWSSDELAGIVDWHRGCLGPASVDISHCCINLTTMYGPEIASKFRQTYLDVVGPQFVHDSFWDLDSLLDWAMPQPGLYPPWLEFGLQRPDQQALFDRYDDYLLSIMNRI